VIGVRSLMNKYPQTGRFRFMAVMWVSSACCPNRSAVARRPPRVRSDLGETWKDFYFRPFPRPPVDDFSLAYGDVPPPSYQFPMFSLLLVFPLLPPFGVRLTPSGLCHCPSFLLTSLSPPYTCTDKPLYFVWKVFSSISVLYAALSLN